MIPIKTAISIFCMYSSDALGVLQIVRAGVDLRKQRAIERVIDRHIRFQIAAESPTLNEILDAESA